MSEKKPSEIATRYVAGFLFGDQSWGRNVALIRKARPTWQAGRCNGIGGRVEDGETPAEAMAREFREETGWTERIEWQEYATLSDARGWIVHFFRGLALVDCHLAIEASTREADEKVEKVQIWHVENIRSGIQRGQIIPNLGWLIPLALDGDLEKATIQERAR